MFFGNPSNWIWNLICCFYWCMSADGVIKMRASFCVKLGPEITRSLGFGSEMLSAKEYNVLLRRNLYGWHYVKSSWKIFASYYSFIVLRFILWYFKHLWEHIQLNPGYSLSGFLCFMFNPYECYPGDVIEYW